MMRKASATTTALSKEPQIDTSDQSPTYERFNSFCIGKRLDLSNQSLTVADLKEVVLFLQHHPDITALDVNSSKIGDEEVATLAQNTTLTSLGVSSNYIGT